MKFLIGLLFAFFACCAATTAFGWGDEGHRTIGAMADKLIAGKAAATHVRALLGMRPLPPRRSGPIWSKAGGTRPRRCSSSNRTIPTISSSIIRTFHSKSRAIGTIPSARQTFDVRPRHPGLHPHSARPGNGTSFFHERQPKGGLAPAGPLHRRYPSAAPCGRRVSGRDKVCDPNGYGKPFKDDQGANRLLFEGTNKLHFFWDVTRGPACHDNAHAQTPVDYAATVVEQAAARLAGLRAIDELDRIGPMKPGAFGQSPRCRRRG